MNLYFNKFPQIYYSNTLVTDISRRVKISTQTRNLPNLYYPYDIKNSVRSDQISDRYYSDPHMDWLILLTNGIVDPYYGWHLDEEQFNTFIEKKYGSIEAAKKKIIFYRMNWATVDLEIPASVYDNNLPENLKKYYTPIFGQGTKILSYKRREEDWTISTNQIVKLEINYNGNTQFSNNELVDIKTGVNATNDNGVEVVLANSSVVILHNVSGNVAVNNYVVGETSGANATITSVTYLANNLVANEKVFWSPVYYYEYEQEKNEANKHVLVIDNSYALQVAEQIRQLLKTQPKDMI